MNTRMTIDILDHLRVETKEVHEFREDLLRVSLTCHGLSDRTDVMGWYLSRSRHHRKLAKRLVAAITDGALFDRYDFEVKTDIYEKTYVLLKWVEWPSGKYLNSVLRKVGY